MLNLRTNTITLETPPQPHLEIHAVWKLRAFETDGFEWFLLGKFLT